MVQLINTKTNYKIILKKNKSIMVRDVYNSLFFSTFGLKKARVFSKEQKLNEKISENADLNSLSDTSIENNDSSDDDDDGYFFKERNPSGYSELPLFKKDIVQDDGTVIQEKIKDNNNDGVYTFLNDYISKYTQEKTNEPIDEDEIYILVPFEVENPIITLNNFSIPDKNSLLMIDKNGITYNVLEKIIYDIYLQIIYLQEKGYCYSEIPVESVLLINNRYIILSIETVSKFSDNDTSLSTKAFLVFLEKLFKDDTLESVLEKIQYTNIYYFIKRAQNENILLFFK